MKSTPNVKKPAGVDPLAASRRRYKSPDCSEPPQIVCDLPATLPVISAEIALMMAFLDEAIDKILNAQPLPAASCEADAAACALVSLQPLARNTERPKPCPSTLSVQTSKKTLSHRSSE